MCYDLLRFSPCSGDLCGDGSSLIPSCISDTSSLPIHLPPLKPPNPNPLYYDNMSCIPSPPTSLYIPTTTLSPPLPLSLLIGAVWLGMCRYNRCVHGSPFMSRQQSLLLTLQSILLSQLCMCCTLFTSRRTTVSA